MILLKPTGQYLSNHDRFITIKKYKDEKDIFNILPIPDGILL